MIERRKSFEGDAPLLYLVATPIGNLSELSPRALEVLGQCDYVACEDTRNTGSLLKAFDLKKPLIACHEHNEEEASSKIVDLILKGSKVACVSDAGYPSLSDPGYRLAKKCLEFGINVSVINGPSAAMAGLIGSGLKTDHFLFYGFLPPKSVARKKTLEELAGLPYTLVFYESPHRIKECLSDLFAVLGDRKAVICRELTKIHEEYIHGTLSELSRIDESTLIGEMVLVIEGKNNLFLEEKDEDIVNYLREKLKTLKPTEAIKEVASEHGLKKNRVYDLYLNHFKD